MLHSQHSMAVSINVYVRKDDLTCAKNLLFIFLVNNKAIHCSIRLVKSLALLKLIMSTFLFSGSHVPEIFIQVHVPQSPKSEFSLLVPQNQIISTTHASVPQKTYHFNYTFPSISLFSIFWRTCSRTLGHTLTGINIRKKL